MKLIWSLCMCNTRSGLYSLLENYVILYTSESAEGLTVSDGRQPTEHVARHVRRTKRDPAPSF